MLPLDVVAAWLDGVSAAPPGGVAVTLGVPLRRAAAVGVPVVPGLGPESPPVAREGGGVDGSLASLLTRRVCPIRARYADAVFT